MGEFAEVAFTFRFTHHHAFSGNISYIEPDGFLTFLIIWYKQNFYIQEIYFTRDINADLVYNSLILCANLIDLQGLQIHWAQKRGGVKIV